MSAIPITLTGTIATAAAARTLPSGRACASFRLAVNHWRIDKDTGEFIDDGTSWFSVDCYGDLASNSSMSLQPGTAVIVTGSLKIRQWDNGERSGIAPTVVAEHIGPDLRYGTAHYRRSKTPDRAQNPGKQASTDAETTQGEGWDGLDSSPVTASAGSDGVRGGYSNAVPGAYSADEANDDDRRQSSAASDDADVETGAGESGSSETNPESESSDDAIARETAAAAAPF
ncbi:single-stranded DNA-binding protein [Brevibacterium atlanticum]|uniref:single-stranded DNA-binding protein n=1 Tax=Brevibacterium atlanticum TaxID=2697563 RepID=UPI00141DE531|nr:single-stranded DNA-binding protein [Brevibacterium atlanticum]